MTDVIVAEIGEVQIITAGLAARDRSRFRCLYGGTPGRKMKRVSGFVSGAGTSRWLICTGMKLSARGFRRGPS